MKSLFETGRERPGEHRRGGTAAYRAAEALTSSLGYNQGKIASLLYMSDAQVSVYWKRIEARFGTRSEFKIALMSRKQGIV